MEENKITLVTDNQTLGNRLRDINGLFWISKQGAEEFAFQTEPPQKKRDLKRRQKELEDIAYETMPTETGALYLVRRDRTLVDVFGRELVTQDGKIGYKTKIAGEPDIIRRRRRSDTPGQKSEFSFDVAENLEIFQPKDYDSLPLDQITKIKSMRGHGRIYRQVRQLEVKDHPDHILVNNHNVFYVTEHITDSAEGEVGKRGGNFIHHAYYIDPRNAMIMPLYSRQKRMDGDEIEMYCLETPSDFCNVGCDLIDEHKLDGGYMNIKFLRPNGDIDFAFAQKHNGKQALAWLLGELKKKGGKDEESVRKTIMAVTETILHYEFLPPRRGLKIKHTTTEYKSSLMAHGHLTYRLEFIAEDDESLRLAKKFCHELRKHPSLDRPAYLADPIFLMGDAGGRDYVSQISGNTVPATLMRALSYVDIPKMRLEIIGNLGPGTRLNQEDDSNAGKAIDIKKKIIDGNPKTALVDYEKVDLEDISALAYHRFNGAREIRDLSVEDPNGTRILKGNFKTVYNQNIQKNGNKRK